MQIKSNTLLKILVPMALFGSIGIGVKSCAEGDYPAVISGKSTTINDLTAEELQILGIEGIPQKIRCEPWSGVSK